MSCLQALGACLGSPPLWRLVLRGVGQPSFLLPGLPRGAGNEAALLRPE